MAKYRYEGAYPATVTLPNGDTTVVKPGQQVELGKAPVGANWTPVEAAAAAAAPRARRAKNDAAAHEADDNTAAASSGDPAAAPSDTDQDSTTTE